MNLWEFLEQPRDYELSKRALSCPVGQSLRVHSHVVEVRPLDAR